MAKNKTITLNEYQTEARKTAIFPKDQALIYTVLGLLSEAGELAGAYQTQKLSNALGERDWKAFLSEAADILWYTAAIADVLGTDLQTIRDSVELDPTVHTAYSKGLAVVGVTFDAGEVASAVKKYIRDADDSIEFKGSKYEQKAIKHLGSILIHIELLALGRHTSISDLMADNLAKLFSRQERGVLGGSGDKR